MWGRNYPASSLAAVQRLLNGLHGSAFSAVLTAYYDTAGHVHDDARLLSTWTDSVSPASSVTVPQIESEVARGATRAGWTTSYDTIIVVLLPPRVTVQGGFCGYHAAHHIDVFHQVPPAFELIAYPGSACFPGWTATDALTLSTSHEFAEAVTDPYNAPFAGSAWWDLGGPPLGEAADACEPSYSTLSLTGGGSAIVANIFSLRKGHCVAFG